MSNELWSECFCTTHRSDKHVNTQTKMYPGLTLLSRDVVNIRQHVFMCESGLHLAAERCPDVGTSVKPVLTYPSCKTNQTS